MDSGLPLLNWVPPPTDRHGETFESAFDFDRLNAQQTRVWAAVKDGGWYTLAEISAASGAPEASASARLRDLRGMFGFKVDRRRRGKETRGLWEYSVTR